MLSETAASIWDLFTFSVCKQRQQKEAVNLNFKWKEC